MGSVLDSVTEVLLTIWDLVNSLLSWLLGLFFSPSLTLEGGHSVKIVRQLAEGGFGFVYLAQDTRREQQQYALKKMLCQTDDHIANAKREIRYHRLFRHPNLLPLIDSAVQHDSVKGGASVFLLFPYIAGGSLRDEINKRVVNGNGWSELSILSLFYGVLQGVKELHLTDPPLAHRDIKPENVLLHGDGSSSPVLVDFGSMANAEVRVKTRSQALFVQDEAATCSTMPYRAPELFDVPSDATIDARVDVWSLGCLLFAMGYGYSPFESEFSTDTGKLRVVECSYLRVIGKIPQDPLSRYSRAFEDLIRWMLQQDRGLRPSVIEVISRVEAILQSKTTTTTSSSSSSGEVALLLPPPSSSSSIAGGETGSGGGSVAVDLGWPVNINSSG